MSKDNWQDGYEKGFKAGKQTTSDQKKPLEALSGSCLPSTEVDSLFSDVNNNLQSNYTTENLPHFNVPRSYPNTIV